MYWQWQGRAKLCVKESHEEIKTNEHSCTQKKQYKSSFYICNVLYILVKQHDMTKIVQITLKTNVTANLTLTLCKSSFISVHFRQSQCWLLVLDLTKIVPKITALVVHVWATHAVFLYQMIQCIEQINDSVTHS